MSPRDVLAFVQAKPFRAFRIRTASGREVAVRHPEMINVKETEVVVYIYNRNDPEGFEKKETISLERIESILPLKSTVV